MGRTHLAIALSFLSLVPLACTNGNDGDARPPVATGPSSAADPGPADEGPGGFVPQPIAWHRCGPVECASVIVPLDYARPRGHRIRLFVSRSAATGKREGSLFYNPGGPGASAAEAAAVLPLLLPHSVTERFDLVGVDPRGAGGSAPLDCGADHTELYSIDPTIEDTRDREALLTASSNYAQGCREGSGQELAHVGTRDAARDLDAVRAAMGDAQLSYLGVSYGTAIGQVYAELFPTRIRSMVLDGVLELGPTGLELAAEQALGFETALQSYAADCPDRDTCPAPDAIGAVEEVLARAEAPGGVPAPAATRPAGPGEAAIGITHALYSEAAWPELDEAVARSLDGDGSSLVGLADQYLAVGDFELYFAISCLDFAWPTGDPDAFLTAAKATALEAPHFGEALTTDYVRCAFWPTAPQPLTAVTAPGTPPILVISTTGDPATPYHAGVAVAERLDNGVLVTHRGEGHGVVGGGNACIDALLAAYLIDGAVPEHGTVCG